MKFREILLFAFLFSPLLAQDEILKASRDFVRGDFISAEKLIAGYLSKNPDDEKAKELYVNILMELTKEALSKGKDEEAREYSQKAYRIAPKNKNVEELYLASRKLEKVEVEPQKIDIKPVEVEKLEAPKISPPKIETRREVVYKTVYEKKEVPKEIVIEKEILRIPSWLWLVIGLNIIVACSLWLYFLYKRRKNREILEENIKSKIALASRLKKEGQNFVKSVGSAEAKRIFSLFRLEELPQDLSLKIMEGDRVFSDVNPVPRLISDVLELSEIFLEDPKERFEFVKPYLDNPNNRVRATAIKVAYPIKSELAYKALLEMASSSNRWWKLSAAWVASVVKDSRASLLLKKLKEDPDPGVAFAAEKYLKNKENENGRKEKVKVA